MFEARGLILGIAETQQNKCVEGKGEKRAVDMMCENLRQFLYEIYYEGFNGVIQEDPWSKLWKSLGRPMSPNLSKGCYLLSLFQLGPLLKSSRKIKGREERDVKKKKTEIKDESQPPSVPQFL
jgi:hypothetical protein